MIFSFGNKETTNFRFYFCFSLLVRSEGRKEGSALWSVNVCRVSKYGTKALRGMTSGQSGDCVRFKNLTKNEQAKVNRCQGIQN